MLRLDRVIKPWKESAALNAHINLFGFWNETTFLTKSGDLGMVLRISGIDYESLDNSEQDYAVKRLESALKGFGVGFHVNSTSSNRIAPTSPSQPTMINSSTPLSTSGGSSSGQSATGYIRSRFSM
jgi:type IV secretory pathway VirB4 component